MFKLLIDDHIPFIEHYFSKYFIIETFHDNEEVRNKLTHQDILVCRSTLTVDSELIQDSQLKILATASSGTNHVDQKALHKQGIEFISAKGANAPAVCDYVTSCLACLDKKKLINEKKIAIVGYGEVGKRLFNRLCKLGFEIGVFDPFIHPNPQNSIQLDELKHFPVITLHPNFHKEMPFPSYHLINSNNIKTLLENVVIINAARGQVVEEEAILSSSFQGYYCADVYTHEPHINPEIIAKATLCTPHIAGHSIDSKKRITLQVSKNIHQLLGLEPPFPETLETQQLIQTTESWQDKALELYNPEIETLELKLDPSSTNFQALRKIHNKRFDFPWQH